MSRHVEMSSKAPSRRRVGDVSGDQGYFSATADRVHGFNAPAGRPMRGGIRL